MSASMVSQACALNDGAKHGLVLWLALARAGVRWPWLGIVVAGLVLCARALIWALLVQAGLVTPWRRR